jgi:hypothetical protein
VACTNPALGQELACGWSSRRCYSRAVGKRKSQPTFSARLGTRPTRWVIGAHRRGRVIEAGTRATTGTLGIRLPGRRATASATRGHERCARHVPEGPWNDADAVVKVDRSKEDPGDRIRSAYRRRSRSRVPRSLPTRRPHEYWRVVPQVCKDQRHTDFSQSPTRLDDGPRSDRADLGGTKRCSDQPDRDSRRAGWRRCVRVRACGASRRAPTTARPPRCRRCCATQVHVIHGSPWTDAMCASAVPIGAGTYRAGAPCRATAHRWASLLHRRVSSTEFRRPPAAFVERVHGRGARTLVRDRARARPRHG